MLTKALRGLKITDEAEGRVKAVFATFDVKDHDGDVTLPGAFADEPVRISAYNHASWAGALPVGKGIISETTSGAELDGQFFMGTTHGRDTFETVKQMGELQEWSYGYDILEAEPGTKDGEPVQFLKRMKVHEVSPVLLGAGIATRTVEAKSRKLATCDECGKSATPLFDGGGSLKALICRDCGHVERKQLDSDLEEEILDAGQERYGSATVYVWLYDHDVDQNFAVYAVCDSQGTGETRYVRVSFTRNDDGTVTLLNDQVNVEPQTTFVPEKARDHEPNGSASADPEGVKQSSDDEGSAEPPKASQDEPGERLKLVDHLSNVQGAVDQVIDRVRDVVTLRSEQGKSLGDETRDRAFKLADQLDASAAALREVVTSAAADESDPAPSGLTLDDEAQLATTAARFGLPL